MKAIVLLLASACLINGLAAYSINFPFDDETPEIEESEKSQEIDDHLHIVFPNDKVAENLIVPFPTDDPNEILSSTPPTSTSRRPTPTWRPTIRPPRPPTTRPPRPPTTPSPAPGRRNPQIYNNAVRSLGPFAGRLVNVVLNKQGAQKTVQENEIMYNLNSILNRTLSNDEEEMEN